MFTSVGVRMISELMMMAVLRAVRPTITSRTFGAIKNARLNNSQCLVIRIPVYRICEQVGVPFSIHFVLG